MADPSRSWCGVSACRRPGRRSLPAESLPAVAAQRAHAVVGFRLGQRVSLVLPGQREQCGEGQHASHRSPVRKQSRQTNLRARGILATHNSRPSPSRNPPHTSHRPRRTRAAVHAHCLHETPGDTTDALTTPPGAADTDDHPQHQPGEQREGDGERGHWLSRPATSGGGCGRRARRRRSA